MSTATFFLIQTVLLTAVWIIMGRRASPVLKRLQRYISQSKLAPAASGGGQSAGKVTMYEALDTRMERVPVLKTLFNRVEDLLVRANIPVKTSEFLIAVLILIVTAQIVQFFLVGGYSATSPLVLAGSLILSFGFLKVYIRIRLGKIQKQLKMSISMLANNIKAGHSFTQALRQVTADLEQPLKGEFELLLNENRLGLSLEVALNNMLRRIPCKELETLVQGVILQQQTGSNLVYILNTIYQTLQDRDELRSKISTLTIQGKISGMICVAIPYLLFWFMHMSQPDYTGMLLYTPIGKVLLAFCIFLSFLGTFFIVKIVRFKF
ncbi:type II secretion system F family protein [bacterium]|nr:type II secretion system F family protein [bacterium]